jgi:hypothetical protein
MNTQHDIPDLIAGALGVSRGTAYDLMREALAEQAQPVAWVTKEDVKFFNMSEQGESTFLYQKKGKWNIPLYTEAPPPRQPLTNEQIGTIWHDFHDREFGYAIRFARAIEAAHGIKE